jgi:hypothetical protein
MIAALNSPRNSHDAFRWSGLAPEPFAPIFALTDEQLAERGIRRVVADRKPGFPAGSAWSMRRSASSFCCCRIATSRRIHRTRHRGPIFIRSGARQRVADPSEVPAVRHGAPDVRARATTSATSSSMPRSARVGRCGDRSGGCSKDAQVRYIHLQQRQARLLLLPGGAA